MRHGPLSALVLTRHLVHALLNRMSAPSNCWFRRFVESVNALHRRHIARHWHDTHAVAHRNVRRDLFEPFVLPRGQHEIHAFSRESVSERQSNADARARQHRDFSTKL
jgi:hypothetical protein